LNNDSASGDHDQKALFRSGTKYQVGFALHYGNFGQINLKINPGYFAR
jgi:hypothetical protein